MNTREKIVQVEIKIVTDAIVNFQAKIADAVAEAIREDKDVVVSPARTTRLRSNTGQTTLSIEADFRTIHPLDPTPLGWVRYGNPLLRRT